MSSPETTSKADLVARGFKDLFWAAMPRGVILRWLFLAEDDKTPRRVGELALRHLARFCFVNRTIFGRGSTTDSFALGVREGRRQVFLEIMKCLNWDEDVSRKFMENDDGR